MAACQPSSPGSLHVQMDFTRSQGFYSAPFPSDDLRSESATGSRINLAGFPNPGGVALIRQTLNILSQDAQGFGVASAVFFALRSDDGSIRLPPVSDSMSADAPVFLLDLASGKRHPVLVQFTEDAGPFAAPNLLSLLPMQGIPLMAKTRYAAVVRRQWPASPAGDSSTAPLHFAQSPQLAQLVEGEVPSGMTPTVAEAYRQAIARLGQLGLAPDDIAGLSVFTTDDPLAQTQRFLADLRMRDRPRIEAPFTRRQIFPEYCVYQTTVPMLDYQQGTPPYLYAGGGWAQDSDGRPVAPHPVRSNLVMTVPRAPMPATGYPTTVYVRTGGGGERPVVERGPQTAPGGPPIQAGTGPALHLARAGFVAVSVDGPLGGLRNPDNEDEQFLIFNIQNPTALRDNVRESAIELAHLPDILSGIEVDTSDCPGAASTTKLDPGRLAIMGHSTGSVIATLAAALQPQYQAVVLSGAGGSWIENVLHKQKPIHVKPVAELLVGYSSEDRSLHEHDPILSLVQWAAESADGQVYARKILRDSVGGPRHVLMLQGIIDNYIRPPIALAESVPLGLDLAGPALESTIPELKGERQLLDVLPLVARGQIDLPARGNLRTPTGQPMTAVVVQHPQDRFEDGHEVVFQSDEPKHQYRCFLQTWLRGTPVVPVGAAADAGCPSP